MSLSRTLDRLGNWPILAGSLLGLGMAGYLAVSKVSRGPELEVSLIWLPLFAAVTAGALANLAAWLATGSSPRGLVKNGAKFEDLLRAASEEGQGALVLLFRVLRVLVAFGGGYVAMSPLIAVVLF